MIKFIIDHREKRSGIPALLKNSNTEIIFKNMLAGDYLIPFSGIFESRPCVIGDYAAHSLSSR